MFGDKSTNTPAIIPPLKEGEDVAEYFKNAAAQAGKGFVDEVGGKDVEWWDMNLTAGPWGKSVPIKDDAAVTMPQVLKDAGYVAGSGSLEASLTAKTTGSSAAYKTGDPCKTKADLDTYIKNTEDQLNSVGDDAQLANVDLQNVLQKQQQTLQMMSNISKMLHDTALAIIRKIGG